MTIPFTLPFRLGGDWPSLPHDRLYVVVQRVRHEVRPDSRVEAVAVDDARFEVVEADPRHRIVSFEDRGPSARIGALVAGVTATATATAPAGSITTTRSVTVLGEPATALAAAPRGAVSVNEEIPGQTATATATAPAGSISAQRNVTIALPVAAAVAAAAPGVVVGQRNITIIGDVSTATASAPAGAVSVIRNALVAGQPATASALAPDGVILAVRNVTVAGQTATATADAPAGKIEFIIHATVAGPVATATALAPDGTVLAVRNVTVAGDVATAAAQAAAGVISTVRNATVSGLVAAASAQAPAGTVQAVRNIALAGPVATASAAAPAGSITAEYNGTPFAYADEFNRTSGLGSNWWRFSSYTLEYPTISSNQFRPGGASTANVNNRRNGAVWATPVPANTSYYVSALISTLGGSSVAGAGVGVIVGANDAGDHYNTNGPTAVYCVIASSGWEIFAANTGGLSSTSTILASLASGTGTFAAGSTLRAEVTTSGLITLKYGATTLAANVNASGYLSGTKVGLAGGVDAARLDNFAASNL